MILIISREEKLIKVFFNGVSFKHLDAERNGGTYFLGMKGFVIKVRTSKLTNLMQLFYLFNQVPGYMLTFIGGDHFPVLIIQNSKRS